MQRCSYSIYDKMMGVDRIIVHWDTVITTYGYVLFHDYLLMPQIADICAAQALHSTLIITERING